MEIFMKKTIITCILTLVAASSGSAQAQTSSPEQRTLICDLNGFGHGAQSEPGSVAPLTVSFIHPEGFRFVASALYVRGGYVLHAYATERNGHLLKFMSTPASFFYFEAKPGVIIGCRLN